MKEVLYVPNEAHEPNLRWLSGAPLTAFVTHENEDGTVNLAVFDHTGTVQPRNNVRISTSASDQPQTGAYCVATGDARATQKTIEQRAREEALKDETPRERAAREAGERFDREKADGWNADRSRAEETPIQRADREIKEQADRTYPGRTAVQENADRAKLDEMLQQRTDREARKQASRRDEFDRQERARQDAGK